MVTRQIYQHYASQFTNWKTPIPNKLSMSGNLHVFVIIAKNDKTEPCLNKDHMSDFKSRELRLHNSGWAVKTGCGIEMPVASAPTSVVLESLVVSARLSVVPPSPDTGCPVETGCEVEIQVDSFLIPSVSQSPDTGCVVETGLKLKWQLHHIELRFFLESLGNSIKRQLLTYIINRNTQWYFSESFDL